MFIVFGPVLAGTIPCIESGANCCRASFWKPHAGRIAAACFNRAALPFVKIQVEASVVVRNMFD